MRLTVEKNESVQGLGYQDGEGDEVVSVELAQVQRDWVGGIMPGPLQ